MISTIILFIVYAVLAKKNNCNPFVWGVAGAGTGWIGANILILIFASTISFSNEPVAVIIFISIINVVIVGVIGKIILKNKTDEMKTGNSVGSATIWGQTRKRNYE